MTYKILNIPGQHQCQLPAIDADWVTGTRIQCTGLVLREGTMTKCGAQYKLTEEVKGWLNPKPTGRRYWKPYVPDYSW